jgi:hypothetical protein
MMSLTSSEAFYECNKFNQNNHLGALMTCTTHTQQTACNTDSQCTWYSFDYAGASGFSGPTGYCMDVCSAKITNMTITGGGITQAQCEDDASAGAASTCMHTTTMGIPMCTLRPPTQAAEQAGCNADTRCRWLSIATMASAWGQCMSNEMIAAQEAMTGMTFDQMVAAATSASTSSGSSMPTAMPSPTGGCFAGTDAASCAAAGGTGNYCAWDPGCHRYYERTSCDADAQCSFNAYPQCHCNTFDSAVQERANAATTEAACMAADSSSTATATSKPFAPSTGGGSGSTMPTSGCYWSPTSYGYCQTAAQAQEQQQSRTCTQEMDETACNRHGFCGFIRREYMLMGGGTDISNSSSTLGVLGGLTGGSMGGMSGSTSSGTSGASGTSGMSGGSSSSSMGGSVSGAGGHSSLLTGVSATGILSLPSTFKGQCESQTYLNRMGCSGKTSKNGCTSDRSCHWMDMRLPRRLTQDRLPAGMAMPSDLMMPLQGNPYGKRVQETLFEYPRHMAGCMDKFMYDDMAPTIQMVKPTLDCLLNEDMYSCQANAACGWAETVCLKKSDADAAMTQINAGQGIGIGDVVFTCMGLMDQNSCQTNTACGWHNDPLYPEFSHCADTATIQMITTAMRCDSYSSNATQCNLDANCGFANMGMGMAFCVDKATAKMMAETTMPGMGDMGDMGSSMPGMPGMPSTPSTLVGPSTNMTQAPVALGPNGMCGTFTCGQFNTEECAPCGVAVTAMFGCSANTGAASCNSDATCSWADVSIGGMTAGMCLDTAAFQQNVCAQTSTQALCNSDPNCAWTNIGAMMGVRKMGCIDADEAYFLAEADAAFQSSSQDLKNLGSTVAKASSTLLSKASQGDLTDITRLGGGDVKAVVGTIANSVKDGAKLGVAAKDAMMDKLKDPTGWGSPASWNASNFEEAAPLLTGLDAADFLAIPPETFTEALDALGSVVDYLADQVDALATQLAAAFPDFSTIDSATLQKAGNIVEAIPAAKLTQITPATFRNATGTIAQTAQKIGAFDSSQKAAIAAKAEETYGDVTSWDDATAMDYVGELAGLIGTFPADKLAALPTAAMANLSSAAITVMGGATAAAAFDVTKLEALPAEAKAAFSGTDLAAVATAAGGADKIKAVLGCRDDTTKCPGAIVDTVIEHDGSVPDQTLMAQVSQAIGTTELSNLKIQRAATPKAASASSTRRRRLNAGTTTTPANTQTIIRAETKTNTAADAVAKSVTTAGVGTPAVVGVTATDSAGGANNQGNNAVMAGTAQVAPSMVATTALAIAAAAVLR